MQPAYSSQSRAERLIVVGRIMVAIFTLLAIRLEPFESETDARLAYALVAAFVAYAFILALLVWRSQASRWRLQVITHGIDLLAFSLILHFTEGLVGPFFVFFLFSLVCATLRWQWRGAFWTTIVALAIFVGIGVYTADVLNVSAFELHRSVYLIVLGILLGYVGAYEKRVYTDMTKLASWPRVTSQEVHVLMHTILEHVAYAIDTARVVMIWEEPEEPWVYLASWSDGMFQCTREPPATFEPPVAAALTSASFLCANAGARLPTVLYTSGGDIQRWSGAPLHAGLQTRFSIGAVLSLPLCGETFKGRLFCLDKRSLTSDDLVLGAIVAHQVTADLDQFYLSRQLQQAAITEERIRLARDLHDGLLQSLTGAALQLHSVQHLIGKDPQTARQRLLEIQQLMTDEQRTLRSFVSELKLASLHPSEPDCFLAARLREASARIERQWGLQVELSIKSPEKLIPKAQADQIYHIVNEALVNAARHAHASAVRAELTVQDDYVYINVADNGCGFPFRGHYDLTRLTALNLGPRTLKERVSSLRGSLTLDSTAAGVCLEIGLPLAQPGV